MAALQPKPVSQSHIQLAQLMHPEHANIFGNVHGGWIMKLCDEAGGLAAMRHAQRPVVTVSIDSMTFQHPVHVGQLITLHARVTWVGRTSIEAMVSVRAENPFTSEGVETNTAYFVYVALDEEGRPVLVPPLLCETDEERERMAAGAERQAYRLSQRNKSS